MVCMGQNTNKMPAHLAEYAEQIERFGGDALDIHEDDLAELWFLGAQADEVADWQTDGDEHSIDALIAEYRAFRANYEALRAARAAEAKAERTPLG